MLILLLEIVIVLSHGLLAWHVGWGLHADPRALPRLCLILLVILLLNPGGSTAVSEVVMHNLPSLPLGLNAASLRLPVIAVVVLLFLETNIL